MGIMDGLNISESALNVHAFRSQVAAENVANVHTKGYQRQVVDLRAAHFSELVDGATTDRNGTGAPRPIVHDAASDGARQGAVHVSAVRREKGTLYDERQNALLATTDMMQAKSAYELAQKAATLLKSLAVSSLEIGRGS